MLTVRTLAVLRDRFPTPAERDRLTAYAGSVRDRLAAARELEQIGPDAVNASLDRLKELYPNFGKYRPSGWEKGYRDMELLLQYAAKAMLFDDEKMLDDQVLTWVRTIFKAVNMTPKFLRDSYTILRDEVRKRAKPRTFVLIEPYLTHTADYLSDIPEPARAEV